MSDYKILFSSKSSDLEKQVNEYLEKGYKLAGGMSCNKLALFQAVYKD
ncbi:DUF1737 domain-containing protein [Empedobacter sp. ULE_I145]|nr:DUF1737 domain-containing protein [Empedobacter falsenii]MBY0066820.1 DUF1737 domain-containing protein [Empedobacter falsenii]